MEIVKEIADDLGESPNGVHDIDQGRCLCKKDFATANGGGLPQVVHAYLSKQLKMPLSLQSMTKACQ